MSILRVVLLTLLIACLAGCGEDEAPQPARAEGDSVALRNAERVLRDELDAAAGALGLELTFERVAPAPCEGADGPTGSVTSGRRARTALPDADPERLLRRAERHWRAAGYHVEVRGEGTGVPGVFATSGGASMSLRVVDGRTAILAGGTPCVPD